VLFETTEHTEKNTEHTENFLVVGCSFDWNGPTRTVFESLFLMCPVHSLEFVIVQGRTLLYEHLTGEIRKTAFAVHCYFGRGFLEKVYANALANRLRARGIDAHREYHLNVRDEDGSVVGCYCADILVERVVIVEVKAAIAFAPEHSAQLLNYLKATRVRVGLLLNFGTARMECKRFVIG
jgi:GxxExxY protein